MLHKTPACVSTNVSHHGQLCPSGRCANPFRPPHVHGVPAGRRRRWRASPCTKRSLPAHVSLGERFNHDTQGAQTEKQPFGLRIAPPIEAHDPTLARCRCPDLVLFLHRANPDPCSDRGRAVPPLGSLNTDWRPGSADPILPSLGGRRPKDDRSTEASPRPPAAPIIGAIPRHWSAPVLTL